MHRAFRNQNIVNQIIEEMKASIISGKERGFNICEDSSGNVFPAETCKGRECIIKLSKKPCPKETTPIGEFHTHPAFYDRNLSGSKKVNKEIYGSELVSRPVESEILMNPIPSHNDMHVFFEDKRKQFSCIGVQTSSNTKMDVGCISKQNLIESMNTVDPSIHWNKVNTHQEIRDLQRNTRIFDKVVLKFLEDAEFRRKHIKQTRFDLF